VASNKNSAKFYVNGALLQPKKKAHYMQMLSLLPVGIDQKLQHNKIVTHEYIPNLVSATPNVLLGVRWP
jgi:hypothetical protein